MSLLRMLVRDRRVWLVVLLALLAVVVGRHALSENAALATVVNAGYWVVLLIFGYFAYLVGRIVLQAWRRHGFSRANQGVLCLVLVSGAVLLAHERYGFKILADELLLEGTSMGMHYDRHAAYPVRATNVQGPFIITQSVLDKRPLLYPFLVSLAHDLTGYRVENAFYVNTVLGFVFLGLIYLVGRRIGGSLWAGVMLVLLFAGLPLLSQQMKGGGFELLNLVVITTVLLLAIHFAERRDEASEEALCAAALLLAFTRYESIILLVPVAALVVWAWWREQRVILTWPVIIAPAFLTIPLLQNRVFAYNASAWELASRGATEPFGWHYVSDNLGHALAFFFDLSGYQPNSPLFAAIGLLACAFFLVWIVGVLRRGRAAEPLHVATACVGAGLFAIWALLMLYFWGQFDDPVIHRLSLPVHLLMAVAIAAVGASVLRSARGWKIGSAIALVGLVVYSLPAMSRRAYGATYSPAAEMEWRTEFLHRFPQHDYLFIDNDSTFWIVHHIPATPAEQARKREDGLIYLLRNDAFSAMYVMQHFRIDPETGARKLEPSDDIGPDFELQPVWERRIETLFIGRISRIVAIHQRGKVVARAGLAVTPHRIAAPPIRSDAQWEKAKQAYLDNWFKQLP